MRTLASLLVLAALATSPAGAQTDPQAEVPPEPPPPEGTTVLGWGGAARHRVEAFREDRAAWQETRFSIQRRSRRGAAVLDVGLSQRDGAEDPFVATDLYREVGDLGYGNLTVQLAPGANRIARTDVRGQAYVDLGGAWEGSLGVRHLTYESNAVTQGTGSVARYVGAWLVRGRAVVSFDEVTSVSTLLSVRYLIDGVGGLTAPFVDVTVGQGQEPVVDPDGTARVRQSFVVAARGQRPLVGPVGLALGLSYTADDTLTRWGADAGLVAQF